MNEISPADIIKWQNEMIKKRQADGKPYKPTYLKTMQSELSAIFNHAVCIPDSLLVRNKGR